MSYWNGTHWVPEGPAAKPPPRPASRTRHALEAVSEGALVALLIVGLMAGTTFAAGAGRGGGVITVPDGAYAGTTTATVNPGGDAWARARCYQNGMMVYSQSVRVDANNQATFQLGPTPLWQGGDASCTAEELTLQKNGRWHVVASTTFNAWD
jgi:hypothetical protein